MRIDLYISGKKVQAGGILNTRCCAGAVIDGMKEIIGIFKELLEIAIADKYTPWKWQNYIPYNGSAQ
ncbi:MAG TPA: hypothetical protein VLZ28_09195 [Daejeonella sp.]|nr:hypothetical protein [Daejeonella sp.]